MVPSSCSDRDRSPLVPTHLQARLLTPGGFWTSVDVVEQTGSTNTDLLAAAASGAPEGSVLVAESQTAGQGRLERRWVSPPRSGLTFSVLLRPHVPPLRLAWLPLLAGLAVQRAVAALGAVPAALKWPNDLLLGAHRRKVCGILAQASGTAVVLGIGLNVTNQRDELPREDATSLALEDVDRTDRGELLVALLERFAADYTGWRAAGADPEASGLLAAYTKVCDTVGRQVAVSLPAGGRLDGEATGIDAVGRLLVRTGDGTTHPVAAGDVLHVR
jgi:BirA family transcriptional regulator, biotin operon repressor / biotin---[acetyl-CoA-carboxylase] ligase